MAVALVIYSQLNERNDRSLASASEKSSGSSSEFYSRIIVSARVYQTLESFILKSLVNCHPISAKVLVKNNSFELLGFDPLRLPNLSLCLII